MNDSKQIWVVLEAEGMLEPGIEGNEQEEV